MHWPNRDRFVLSAGHGRALLYALLHVTGFDLPLAELERFRQWGSLTPGSIAANKVARVRAGLIHDVFSAHQGVEDDDMDVFCLGGNVIGWALALERIERFLTARFSGAARHAVASRKSKPQNNRAPTC